jgi:hypothetical protein
MMFLIGIVMAIIGALAGADYMWKCDYCWRKFDNKADCIRHEKNCKKKFKEK